MLCNVAQEFYQFYDTQLSVKIINNILYSSGKATITF